MQNTESTGPSVSNPRDIRNRIRRSRRPGTLPRAARSAGFFGLISVISVLFLLSTRAPAAEAEPPAGGHRVADLGLEELMEIEVAIAARRPEPVRDSPAAVHVVTGDDIRRSGATSLPEALRLVPGIHVGRVNSSQWAVSTRGFSDVFANKQLVMIDGRSVYTPLFSGVFWDAHDTFLEDIARIEVVNGPGGSLWGANAVNGVVNVITKDASETQGTMMYAGSGTFERGFTGVRHGGELGDAGHFRVFAKHFDRDSLQTQDGEDADDRWYVRRSGFRADLTPPSSTRITLEGDVYQGELSSIVGRVEEDPDPARSYRRVPQTIINDIHGGHLLGRLRHVGADSSEGEVQVYYDHNVRDSDQFREDRRTLDLEAQHTFRAGERHQFVWGGGYRATRDRIENSFDISLDPDSRTDHLFSAFLQDDIELVRDRLTWTLGSKFEHNDYTGFEVQPNTRLLWRIRERQVLWGAVSRAVRTPSRAEHDIRLNSVDEETGTLVSIFGQDGYESEELIAYELGYRIQPARELALDFALFYNDYDELRGLDSRGVQFDPSPHIRFDAANVVAGETYGGEASATWRANEWWRLRTGYSLLRMQLRTNQPDPLQVVEVTEGRSPRHQVFLRSAVNLPAGWEFDAAVRYVDNLTAPGARVSAYTEADARIAWRPEGSDIEFSLVGRNLLRSRHTEAKPSFIATQGSRPERNVYGQVKWHF